MNQHLEIAGRTFLNEWTKEMTKQLITRLNEVELEKMDEYYYISVWDDEDDDVMDV